MNLEAEAQIFDHVRIVSRGLIAVNIDAHTL